MSSDNIDTQSASIFGRFANLYYLVFGNSLEKGRKLAGDFFTGPGGRRILEVGVGTGLTFRHYPAGTDLVGIDLNQPMLDKAAERALKFPEIKIELQRMDATAMSFPSDSFDYVYAPSVLSVVNNATAAFKEMIRVCRPGGYIVAICFARHEAKAWHAVAAKVASPLTEKFLGFHMHLKASFFRDFPEVDLVREEDTNHVGPMALSAMFVLRKR